MQLHCFTADKITKMIIACCVIHNICITEKDLDDSLLSAVEDSSNLQEHEEIDSDQNERVSLLKRLGEIKRDSLAKSFSSWLCYCCYVMFMLFLNSKIK